MKPRDPDDLSNLSMLELFRVEAENQTARLTSGLLELEAIGNRQEARGPSPIATSPSPLLESLMRAAHSLKGAARIVNLSAAVTVAHAMEDCFVGAQHGQVELGQAQIDTLLRGVDLLVQVSRSDEAQMATWETDRAADIEKFLQEVAAIMPGNKGQSVKSSVSSFEPEKLRSEEHTSELQSRL